MTKDTVLITDNTKQAQKPSRALAIKTFAKKTFKLAALALCLAFILGAIFPAEWFREMMFNIMFASLCTMFITLFGFFENGENTNSQNGYKERYKRGHVLGNMSIGNVRNPNSPNYYGHIKRY